MTILKPCNNPICYVLVEVVDRKIPCYCPEHLNAYYSNTRSKYVRTRYGSNWSKIRNHKLHIDSYCECKDPECGVCHGEHGAPEMSNDILMQRTRVLATEVDHLVRFSRWQNKHSANKWLQSLCKPCHSSKTNRELRGLI